MAICLHTHLITLRVNRIANEGRLKVTIANNEFWLGLASLWKLVSVIEPFSNEEEAK